MVRWSTSWDARGRHASTRAASLAHVPTSGQPAASRARTSSTSRSRGTSTSRQSRSAPGCSSSAGPYRVPPTAVVGHGSRQVIGSSGVPSASTGSPIAAQASVASTISTRSMNFMRFSQAASPIGVSVISQVVSPSSTTPPRARRAPAG